MAGAAASVGATSWKGDDWRLSGRGRSRAAAAEPTRVVAFAPALADGYGADRVLHLAAWQEYVLEFSDAAAAQLALAEHVRRIRQPVAQPRLRLNGVAVAPQGADRLPHRRAGDAELRGDVLAGDEVSRLRAEQRKNFFLTHRLARLLLIS